MRILAAKQNLARKNSADTSAGALQARNRQTILTDQYLVNDAEAEQRPPRKPQNSAGDLPGGTETRFVHDFSRIPVSSYTSANKQGNSSLDAYYRNTKRTDEDRKEPPREFLAIQKKSLAMSDPDDPDEKEADEIARKIVDGRSAEAGKTQHIAGNGQKLEVAPGFHSALERSRGGGHPLDALARREMESKMGVDLGGVRIHTGGEAHGLSRSINSRAFTHGQDIFFKQGEFNTASRPGKELLAHELVHTQQQKSGLHRKIQRQTDDEKRGSGFVTAFLISEVDVTKQVKAALLSLPSLANVLAAYPPISVEATLTWHLVKPEVTKEDLDEMNNFKKSDAELRFDKYFFKIALKAYEQNLLKEESPAAPGLEFEINLAGPSVDIKWNQFTFKLAGVDIKASYTISQENLPPESFPLSGLIKDGKASLKSALNISISYDPKMSKYFQGLAEKTKKSAARQTHIEEEKTYRKKAGEAEARKKTALGEKEKLKNNIKQQNKDLKQLSTNKDLNSPEMNEKIQSLEKEVAEQKNKIKELDDVLKKEKDIKKAILEAAKKERDAAKKIEDELEGLEKKLKNLRRKSNKLQKALRKFEKAIEKQMAKFEKLSRRLSEKASVWIEKKAVRWVGQKIAKVAAKLVAKAILRAIPILGELLLLWDAATLIWDIASALWDWFTGKKDEGEGEDDGPEKDAEDGEKGELEKDGEQGKTEEKDISDGGGKDKKPGQQNGELEKGVPGGHDSLPLGNGHGEKGLPDQKAIPPVKDEQNEIPSDATDTRDKTLPVRETGKVQPYQAPTDKTTLVRLISFQAIEVKTDGKLYFFRLVMNYVDDEGKHKVLVSDQPEVFRLVSREIKTSPPSDLKNFDKTIANKFMVETPFVLQTKGHRVYFAKDFPITIRN